jgi:histone-lysine N-methyltransferase SETMAR
LHHDNAPAHTALSVREFLAAKQITVLEHPASPPDLAPSDFFLFPKIKEILKDFILMTLMTSAVIQRQL